MASLLPASPEGILGNTWRPFRFPGLKEGVPGIWSAQTKDAAKHTLKHRTVSLTAKKDPVQYDKGAKVQQPRSRSWNI